VKACAIDWRAEIGDWRAGPVFGPFAVVQWSLAGALQVAAGFQLRVGMTVILDLLRAILDLLENEDGPGFDWSDGYLGLILVSA